MCVSTQYVNSIIINEELMWNIEFQALLVFLNLPNDIF